MKKLERKRIIIITIGLPKFVYEKVSNFIKHRMKKKFYKTYNTKHTKNFEGNVLQSLMR